MTPARWWRAPHSLGTSGATSTWGKQNYGGKTRDSDSPGTPVTTGGDSLENERILVAKAVVAVCGVVRLGLVLGGQGGD